MTGRQLVSITMSPSQQSQSPGSPITVFDVGVIEVQALEMDDDYGFGSSSSSSTTTSPLGAKYRHGSSSNSRNGRTGGNGKNKQSSTSPPRYATRIMMGPAGNNTDIDDHRAAGSSSGSSGRRYEMGAGHNSSCSSNTLPGRGGLSSTLSSSSPFFVAGAESFDSTDEIVENSNEANLFKKIVERRATDYQDRQNRSRKDGGSGCSGTGGGLRRNDSFASDTNSVNSNEPFMSLDDDDACSQEMEYLDVLNFDPRTGTATSAIVSDFSSDDEMDDLHPNKKLFQNQHSSSSNPEAAIVDDLIDSLCIAPCGECAALTVEPTMSSIMVVGGSALPPEPLPSALRKRPRYSSTSSNNSSRLSSSLDNSMEQVDDEEAEDDDLKLGERAYFNCVPGSGANKQTKTNARRSVQFKDVDIREFKMTLGNHPSATSGPPVMLSSELNSPRKVMTLEQYEQVRPPRRKRRQLKLSLQQRHNVLVKERGFSFEEVKGAWQEALEIRKQRKETLERGLAMMKWDEVWESTCRKFNRLVDITTI